MLTLVLGGGSFPFFQLVAPYRAILRYYRCDTSYRAILSQGGWHFPKMVRYPPPLDTGTSVRYPVLLHIARYLCDTPSKQAQMSFAILSLQGLRDLKSIKGSLRGRVVRVVQRFLELCRFLKRFSEVFTERGFRGPPEDPLRGRFPSQRLSVLLPLIV